mmetsp:Transcript_87385/g.227985  ORF Transcript_87385/g.227985 Transcript_87385/m.227985 type:complete len:229 (+) Transcript_87385:475-1161(+)
MRTLNSSNSRLPLSSSSSALNFFHSSSVCTLSKPSFLAIVRISLCSAGTWSAVKASVWSVGEQPNVSQYHFSNSSNVICPLPSSSMPSQHCHTTALSISLWGCLISRESSGRNSAGSIAPDWSASKVLKMRRTSSRSRTTIFCAFVVFLTMTMGACSGSATTSCRRCKSSSLCCWALLSRNSAKLLFFFFACRRSVARAVEGLLRSPGGAEEPPLDRRPLSLLLSPSV